MRERADRMRVELANRFTACFVPKGLPAKVGPVVSGGGLAAPKPLMIGIAEQLYDACPDLDRHDLANVLANYTTEPSYYQATIAGAERIDLSGATVGVVTLAAENHAKAKLRRMALCEAK